MSRAHVLITAPRRRPYHNTTRVRAVTDAVSVSYAAMGGARSPKTNEDEALDEDTKSALSIFNGQNKSKGSCFDCEAALNRLRAWKRLGRVKTHYGLFCLGANSTKGEHVHPTRVQTYLCHRAGLRLARVITTLSVEDTCSVICSCFVELVVHTKSSQSLRLKMPLSLQT